MGYFRCLEGLARLLAPYRARYPRMAKAAMLPPPSFQHSGSKCTRSHRSLRGDARVASIYRLSSKRFGKGNFGTVCRSVCKDTGSLCALKVVRKRGMAGDVLEGLANEIAIHQVCMHPNIVRMFESFEDPRKIHIVLEACEGGEVYQMLQAQGTLDEVSARAVLQQLLQAVFYLHDAKHVAHRDLKPENLLLKFKDVPVQDNIVKLIDFGFAASFTPGVASFVEPCGTPVYMGPELVAGPYDEKCDIWSCGIILHELLTGKLPFTSTTALKTVRMAGRVPLRLYGVEWANVSKEARQLVLGMCSKDPKKRMSADEALRSSWIGKGKTAPCKLLLPKPSSIRKIGHNIREFPALSDFQRAALRLTAYRLDDPDVADQRCMFSQLDRDGNGRLSLQEMLQHCSELELTTAEAGNLFEKLDSDGSGSIEYVDFLSAAVNRHDLPSPACRGAFRFFDRDGDGSITPEEVREATRESDLPGMCPDVEEMDFPKFVSVLRRDRMGGA